MPRAERYRKLILKRHVYFRERMTHIHFDPVSFKYRVFTSHEWHARLLRNLAEAAGGSVIVARLHFGYGLYGEITGDLQEGNSRSTKGAQTLLQWEPTRMIKCFSNFRPHAVILVDLARRYDLKLQKTHVTYVYCELPDRAVFRSPRRLPIPFNRVKRKPFTISDDERLRRRLRMQRARRMRRGHFAKI